MVRFYKIFGVALIGSLFILPFTTAKVQPLPTPEKAIQTSRWIVVAQYQGYEKQEKISWEGGVKARFKITKLLKTSEPNCPQCNSFKKVIPVVYGMMSEKGRLNAKEGKILIGGSTPQINRSPVWYCKKCSRKFGKFTLPLPYSSLKPNTDMTLHYRFESGSWCIPLKGWKFSKDKMPGKGTSWILFLTGENSGIYETYRGDYGRWEGNKKNTEKVKKIIKKEGKKKGS